MNFPFSSAVGTKSFNYAQITKNKEKCTNKTCIAVNMAEVLEMFIANCHLKCNHINPRHPLINWANCGMLNCWCL